MTLMRAAIWTLILCGGVGYRGAALAGPGVDAHAKYQAALQLVNSGNADQALALIDEGLAAAPKDTALLGLKGQALLALRDYAGALAAYEADLAANAKGANQRTAKDIVKRLSPVRTTFLEITLASGPAAIYLESRSQGVFCTAAPSCNKQMLPGPYPVIVERPGFDVWTGSVTVAANTTTKLAVTLVEKPSSLTVRASPPGAHITVDGTAYDAPTRVAAGSHQVVASLAGHVEARREVAAHEGKPVDLEIPLTPLVPVHLEPATAALALDGKPVALQDGGIAVPPGDHTLVARAPGFVDGDVKIPAVLPADYQVAITLAPVAPAAPRPPPPAPVLTGRRKIAIAAGGVALAAAAAGVVLGIQSMHSKDDALALCPSPSSPCEHAREADDAFRNGRTGALRADVAFGVAGAAAITAAILWLTGAPESRAAVSARLGAITTVDVAVRF